MFFNAPDYFMKKYKILLCLLAMGALAYCAFADSSNANPNSNADHTKHTPPPWATNHWWTNVSGFTNSLPPGRWTNHFPVTLPPGLTNVPPRSAPNRVPPADLQSLVQRFQNDRDALVSQLKGASDQERDKTLAELKDLRDKFRDEMGKLREDARQEAQSMKARLHDDRSRALNQGTEGHKGR